MATEAARSGADPWDGGGIPQTFSSSLPATAESVGRLRRTVTEFARRNGATPLMLESIALAVSEALSNVVVHAYRDAPAPGALLVMATLDERDLLVVVADEGLGMTPRNDSPGLGHGLGIMATLADSLEIAARGAGRSGVVLRMRFGLAG